MSLPPWCPPYSSCKTDVSGEKVYCICKKPDNGELMVGCDGCDDWFHFKCLNIPELYSKLAYSFHCPYCEAGITGPACQGASELPKTIWKRKCRLNKCYEPCLPNSKYCSDSHGEEYMRAVLAKVEIPGLDHNAQLQLFKDMASYHKNQSDTGDERFRKLGNEEFIQEEPRDHDPSLYEEIVKRDKRLIQLQNDLGELENSTIPATKSLLETLNKYLEWLQDINLRLTPGGNSCLQNDTTKKNKRKADKTKAKQRRRICGYSPDFQIPCTAEAFINDYVLDAVHVKGICVKIHCNRHSAWTEMRLEHQERQLDTLESYHTRLKLLIKARIEQLHIQYYEQLLRRKT